MIQRLSKQFWVIEKQLGDSLMNQLKQIVDNIDRGKPKMKNKLAGQLDDEYPITYSDDVMKFINSSLLEHKDKINSYEKSYRAPTHYDTLKLEITNQQSWINFQKKYEYNPFHRHSGDFSFVIWYKIPYTSEDEANNGPGQGKKKNKNGCFSFIYDEKEADIRETVYLGDTKSEGTFLLFPAALPHLVYPFFSTNEERISFSGNLFLKTDEEAHKKIKVNKLV